MDDGPKLPAKAVPSLPAQTASDRDRGRFKPGNRPVARRAKGVPNKFTRDIKEALTNAAEQLGQDGKGKDGVTGLFKRVGEKDPAVLAALLTKAMPREIKADVTDSTPAQVMSVQIVAIPPGHYVITDQVTGAVVLTPEAEAKRQWHLANPGFEDI